MTFAAAWAAILYAQLMVSAHPAMYAGDCSFSFTTTATTQNANMAAAAIVMAGISGYLLCNPRRTWGKSAWISSLVVCSVFTVLVALWSFLWVLILLDRPDAWEGARSGALTGITQALTVVPGLAAVSTLVVCWVLRHSNISRVAATLIASLLPALWYALAVGIFVVAAAMFCA
ncbi:hypothetical protein ACX3O0_13840 [Homoserinimonas sp. A447]